VSSGSKVTALMNNAIYTIGHSNHSPEKFAQLLTDAKIEVLVDVRSNPGSPWVLHANPRDLKRILQVANIRYIYLGDVLGGRTSDPDCYDSKTGKVDYQAMLNKESFQRGLNRLFEDIRKHHVCIMCAEENPTSCHRNLLVGEGLRQRGVQILHIRGNGQIQTDEELWKEKAGVVVNQLQLPI
jgi:uncharacterized protein (DUF488 family)